MSDRGTPFTRFWMWCMDGTDTYCAVTGLFGDRMATENVWMTYEQWYDIVKTWDHTLLGIWTRSPYIGRGCQVLYDHDRPFEIGRYRICVVSPDQLAILRGVLQWNPDYDIDEGLHRDVGSGSVTSVNTESKEES